MDHQEPIVSFSTCKISSIKRLFDILKEVKEETPFIFTPTGIHVYIEHKTNIVSTFLNSDSFEEYVYNTEDENKLYCFCSRQVYPIIKSINSDNSLRFSIYSDESKMYIQSINTTKKKKEQVCIKLLDIEDQEDVTKTLLKNRNTFSGVNYNLPCVDIIEIIKKFNYTDSKTLRITHKNNSIEFSTGDVCNIDILSRSITIEGVHSGEEQERIDTVFDFKLPIKPIYYFIKGMNTNKNSHQIIKITLAKKKHHCICVFTYQLGDFGDISLVCINS